MASAEPTPAASLQFDSAATAFASLSVSADPTAATAASAAAAAFPTAVEARESRGTASYTFKRADVDKPRTDEEEEAGLLDASLSSKSCMSRCACDKASTLEASAETMF